MCDLIVDLNFYVTMYGRYVVIMSFPVSANSSDTVKTHIKEHVLWVFRLMFFLYIGQR